jgi:hypothetical protein
MTDGLFEMTPTPPPARERLSADRARTERQRLLISRGHHPLAYLGAARHPDTVGVAYERTDPRGRDLTCGSCRFRELFSTGNRTVPKCTASVSGAYLPRVQHSVSSDVRAWWPACRDYQKAT